ncbi:MAG: hypothetical protein SFZ23_02490 [Planctomycetota bacterium]|nr:hypothetical protein [Planctomycetota bacterium]
MSRTRVDLSSPGPAAKGSGPSKAKSAGPDDAKKKIKLIGAGAGLVVAGGLIAWNLGLFEGSGADQSAPIVTTTETAPAAGKAGTRTVPPPIDPNNVPDYIPPDDDNVRRGGSRTAPGVPRRDVRDPAATPAAPPK